jgi:hypothetical protein
MTQWPTVIEFLNVHIACSMKVAPEDVCTGEAHILSAQSNCTPPDYRWHLFCLHILQSQVIDPLTSVASFDLQRRVDVAWGTRQRPCLNPRMD